MSHAESLRLAALFGGLGVFLAAETILRARPWLQPRAKRLAFHGGLALLNTVIVRLTVAAPLAAFAAWTRREGWGLAPLFGLEGAAEVLVSLAVLDWLDYWWHRWNHRWAFLWRFHKVHHSDTHLDATTSLRFHFGELLLSGGVKALWLLAWGPSVAAFLLFEAGITLAAQFHHSNFDLRRIGKRAPGPW